MLKQGAYDNTLAVSETENFWRTAFKYEDYAIHDDYVYSDWKPWDDVEIKNFVVPSMPWHVRVHKIDTKRTIHLAEGGFAAPDYGTDNQKEISTNINNAIFYRTEVGITGMIGLSKELKAELSVPEPNTNILFPKTKIPLQTGVLKPGKYTLVSLYLGDRELESLDENGNLIIPKVQLNGNQLSISIKDHTSSITLAEF